MKCQYVYKSKVFLLGQCPLTLRHSITELSQVLKENAMQLLPLNLLGSELSVFKAQLIKYEHVWPRVFYFPKHFM